MFKLFIENRMNKGLEEYKAQLATERDRQLHQLEIEKSKTQSELEKSAALEQERFKSSLELLVAERIHQQELVQDRRLEVVCKMYELLMETQWEIGSLIKVFQYVDEPDDEEKVQSFGQAYQAFVEYYGKNEILLDDDVVEDTNKVIEIVHSGIIEYTTFREFWHLKDPEIKVRDAKSRDRARKQLEGQLPPLKKKMRSSLRTLIGIGNNRDNQKPAPSPDPQ